MNRLPKLTAALLASAAAFTLFTPFEGTMAGSKLYICATPQPTALDQAGYEALTWVEITGVGDMSEVGSATNILTYDTWGDDVVRKQKGMTNAGDPTVELAYDPTLGAATGQGIIETAALTKFYYAFKVVHADELVTGGVGTVDYHRGLVTGPTHPQGRNEDFDLNVYTLGLVQRELRIKPTLGNPPINTVLPAITGTAQVGVTLTTTNGTWVGDATITYARQWRANGVAIPGATATTYQPVVADIGKYISCAVTATNLAGQGTAYSASTAAVIAA